MGQNSADLIRVKEIFAEGDNAAPRITIDQDADENALLINSAATTSSNYGLRVNGGTAGAGTVYFNTDANDFFKKDPQTSATGSTYIYRNLGSATTAGPLLKITNGNTGDDQSALVIDDNSIVASGSINIDKDVASSAAVCYGLVINSDVAAGGGAGAGIDLSGFSAGEMTINFPAGTASTVNPGADNAEEGWINIGVAGTVRYIPYAAAS